ncbi:hypothetical protein Glove_37g62 [Diversispora epigaea]|uniref:Uncharacterized protein n=1 Tax=Diversispora epigaea TaxID=1348612 RepID=A0A397JJ39_9GLOM|nr:hypothetical protein Glove_37g62 [Diversispora epigaea]
MLTIYASKTSQLFMHSCLEHFEFFRRLRSIRPICSSNKDLKTYYLSKMTRTHKNQQLNGTRWSPSKIVEDKDNNQAATSTAHQEILLGVNYLRHLRKYTEFLRGRFGFKPVYLDGYRYYRNETHNLVAQNQGFRSITETPW